MRLGLQVKIMTIPFAGARERLNISKKLKPLLDEVELHSETVKFTA